MRIAFLREIQDGYMTDAEQYFLPDGSNYAYVFLNKIPSELCFVNTRIVFDKIIDIDGTMTLGRVVSNNDEADILLHKLGFITLRDLKLVFKVSSLDLPWQTRELGSIYIGHPQYNYVTFVRTTIPPSISMGSYDKYIPYSANTEEEAKKLFLKMKNININFLKID